MDDKNVIEIKCPKCGSKNFDCYDTDCDMKYTTHWNLCCCDDCGADFKIKYIAVEIETND